MFNKSNFLGGPNFFCYFLAIVMLEIGLIKISLGTKGIKDLISMCSVEVEQ